MWLFKIKVGGKLEYSPNKKKLIVMQSSKLSQICEAYSRLCQTSKLELSAKSFNDRKLLLLS